jgi:rhodanese-related sulfurtransferase
MNLWKLWIVDDCSFTGGYLRGRRDRASMKGMTEWEVKQADVGEVPTTFGDSVVLLDVREDDEWQLGHAAGALHIPMGEVPARMDEIDPDVRLFVICHAGGRSHRVAQYLARNGYEAANVDGGMVAWAGAGRPVVTDDGGVGSV